MIAAHYIGLLLLSTAAEGSPEHQEIVEMNGAGVWHALAELNLVGRPDDLKTGNLWVLTERGRVLVDYILDLPLPEQVSAWKMPGVSIVMPRMPIVHVNSADEGEPPPPAPPASLAPRGFVVPTDPAERDAKVLEMLNSGYGQGEVAEIFGMSREQVDAIFFGRS